MASPAASSGVPATSTGPVDRTQRLDVWRDLIRDHFVALDIDAERHEDFRGTVRSTRVGHLDIATVESTSQVCRRSRALAHRDDAVYLQVGLLTQGAAVLSQDGRAAQLSPGDYAIYETDRPFVWDLHGSWQLQVFTWARAAIPLSEAGSRGLTARTLDGTTGLGRLVGRMLRDLAGAPPELTAAGGIRLADEIGELVTTVAAEAGAPGSAGRPGAMMGRIEAYIADHLSDPALDAEQVARAHFLSTRSLHRLFARDGGTVAARIRRQRLDRCRRDLADPRLGELPIAAIARRWGFPDPGTFSRTFRAAYGMSPSAHRAAVTAHS